MSRIPKIGFKAAVGGKENNENVSSVSSRSNYGFKRPSDDHLPGTEKKLKSSFDSVSNKKILSGSQSSNFYRNKLNADQKAKQVLPPIPDTGLVRSSMPAVTSTTKMKIPGKTKRPAWDLKGRIQDMEENFRFTQEYNNTLKQELEAYNQRIASLEAEKNLLHKDNEIKSVMSEEAHTQLQELKMKLKEKTEEFEGLFKEKEKLYRDLTDLQSTSSQEICALKSSITSLTCMRSGIQAQLDAAESLIENLQRENKRLKSVCEEQELQIKSQKESILEYESKLRQEETIRRKLHNTVQELKGNIRVFCRLRPPLPEEIKNGMNLANIVPISDKAIEIQQLPEGGLNEVLFTSQKTEKMLKFHSKKLNRAKTSLKSGGKIQPKYEFSFDYYFSSTSSQETVFAEISQLVQSALDGYNVCIFAYGQTGSGKTFTMEGPSDIVDFIANKDHPNLGMIPRSVQQIFSTIADLEPKGWKYSVQALFLEIYNERIQDLLSSSCANTKCEIIKSGGKGNECILSNVTASDVSSVEQVYELMKKAHINRAVASTKCNEHSSRSHFVFQLKIHGENWITSEKCDATLSLVDLAGSERVKDSQSTGNRLTEAKAINKSLSNLGKVIMSLSKKENHIPYRDSKLTHLLANSLGGNSKTLMFVNISPDHKNLTETINSLRFATTVNQCVIGTAQKTVK